MTKKSVVLTISLGVLRKPVLEVILLPSETGQSGHLVWVEGASIEKIEEHKHTLLQSLRAVIASLERDITKDA